MTKSLDELRKNVKPEVQAAARAKAINIIADMSLSETRKARGLNQATVASKLNIAQSNISQMEARPDALLSTLNQYIKALGGKLEVYASFPDGQQVRISQFDDKTPSKPK